MDSHNRPDWPLERLAAGTPDDPATVAAGVRRVALLGPAGLYRRSPPRALDLTAEPPQRRDAVRAGFQDLTVRYAAPRCVAVADAMVHDSGLVRGRDGLGLRGDAGALPPPSRRIGPPSLLLTFPGWRNPRAWLAEAAAALAFAARLALPQPWQIVIGQADDTAHQAAMAALCAALAPGVPVLAMPDDAVWQFDCLLHIGPVQAPPALHHPEGLANLRAALLRHQIAAPPASPQRLFLSQGPAPARRLRNAAELQAIAAQRGFTVLDPATVAPADWPRLFHGAAHVVAAPDDLLAYVVFCAPAAALTVLAPAGHADPGLWDLASHAGVHYAEMRGATAPDGGFSIAAGGFATLLGK